MSAEPDWTAREAALARLLTTARTLSVRAQLSESLADYSRAAVREARRLGSIVPGAEAREQALGWLLCPVFVCGHHRSGTTLLQNLLDGHPELLSLPSEATYFSSFAYVARRASADEDLDRFAAEWISRFVDPTFEPHFRLGRCDGARVPPVDFARCLFGWHAGLRDRVPEELAALLALVAAYRAVAAPTSTPRAWTEKTPLNERLVARFEFFGAARFIHVVRDPRAVLASLAALYRTVDLARFDVAESAKSIGRSFRLAKQNPRRLGDRYLVVRYEDLVGDPTQQIERVRQFLGIAPHATLSLPTAGGHAVAPNSSFGRDTAGIGRARPLPELPDGHLALLGVHAAAEARSFGYELPMPPRVLRYALRARYFPRQLLRAAQALRRFARAMRSAS